MYIPRTSHFSAPLKALRYLASSPHLFAVMAVIFFPSAAIARPYLSICSYGPRINCIVDGDTLWLDHHKIRLEDIDAPEISAPHCRGEKALGEKAKFRLQQLLNGSPFTVVQVGRRSHDVYGRDLRTLKINERSVGQVLVAEGLAHEWVGHKLSWCR